MAEDVASPRTPLSASFMSHHRDYSSSSEFISKLKKAVRDGNLLQVTFLVREVMETVSRAQVSIAVTGDSGNGMSSFINALREIGHEEAASAPTGVVRTTLRPAMYTSPTFPSVSFWDLPGMGASDQSLNNYLGELQIGYYDFFLLITSEQFSMHHVRLAKAIQESGKRFYIIWTKVDRDLSTTPLSKILLLRNIRENILENLQQGRVQEPPIFMVSSLDPSLHDFPSLRKKLEEDICCLRCHRLQEGFFQICEEALSEKEDSLKAKMNNFSKYLQDTLGVGDTYNPEQCLRAYRLQFGMHEESLRQVALNTGRELSEYSDTLTCRNWDSLRRANFCLWLQTFCVVRALLFLLRCIPRVGFPVYCYFERLKHTRIVSLVTQNTMATIRKIWDYVTCPA
ncbi:immunity-related GTPase family M protein isoform X2 [Octodon degus]|nr:immunity-related GTPase family M protein isoform X2 [Octodon degus]XP_023568928.1 immunity-related GTPase family M protein isoform X2 [Octodon degus]